MFRNLVANRGADSRHLQTIVTSPLHIYANHSEKENNIEINTLSIWLIFDYTSTMKKVYKEQVPLDNVKGLVAMLVFHSDDKTQHQTSRGSF